jgi:TolB-like protein/Tfp pilus assembly protein PilF
VADVFVSYVSEDRDIAEQISRGLEGAGFSVWWDRHIHGGVDFATEIERQLSAAKIVLVLWSKAALDSKWVRDEAQQARDDNKLIPIRLDTVQPPLGFRQAQALDFGGWNGDARSAAFVALIDSTRYFVGEAEHQPVVHRARARAEKSIAVLPFTDMSEKKDQEYLADGMAEEIINLLARVPYLLVSARTSSFYFKGKQTKIPDIARELGVAHVLEGSIRRSGDHLRVTAQLARADNGYHLWSETYDRELQDVFKVQDDIANAVVQALQIKLMGGELSRRKGGTQNLEAYQLYLRAVSSQNQLTKSSVDAAGEYLDQAIKLDPNYGKAWASLASNALSKIFLDALDSAEGNERARHLTQHALQLSPDLVDARALLVTVLMLNWDWAAAEAEAQRALAIDPTNANALGAAGYLSLTLGHWDDAERQARAAVARDPLNPRRNRLLGDVYYRTGRYAEAEVMYRKVRELGSGGTHHVIGAALLLQGKAEAALAMVQQEPDEGNRLWYLPIMLRANGRMAEADEALKALIARWADRDAFPIAINYAYRGDHDLALQWLERVYTQKQAGPVGYGIVGQPLLKNIADDPRYKAFLRKLKLPD